ncbi:LysM peptidoglycan-binding domain-containing protein [Bacillus songklensis]|uniref:LysM peptidoglycan-binding domain-containing protein n=1 Tax=Bacillus songklensis TaxID=1069116 RepID=A0ABV8B938_9BACI
MKKLALTMGTAAMLSAGFSGQAFADTHQVKKGDTLWGIAQEHNTTVDQLKDWNKLNSDLIYPKQVLTVSPEETTYIVKKGDTLFKISQAHGVSVKDLMNVNGLSSDLIHPGDSLTIKTGGNAIAPAKQEIDAATSVPAPAPQPAAPAASQQPAQEPAGKEMTVTATAYTANCEGCSGITATGVNLKENPSSKVIAVDPSVIPLGSKVYVEGYGYATAADTGSAIKGNKIDVFLPSQDQAVQWGVKTVNVKVVE